jgi:hypothetical protein
MFIFVLLFIFIIGPCTSEGCVAYKKDVIYTFGYGLFNLKENKPSCPMCSKTFIAVKPGFNNCGYRYLGMLTDGKIQVCVMYVYACVIKKFIIFIFFLFFYIYGDMLFKYCCMYDIFLFIYDTLFI